jgi:hypothetical protein
MDIGVKELFVSNRYLVNKKRDSNDSQINLKKKDLNSQSLSSISSSNLIQTQQATNSQLTPQSANLANQQQSANSKIQPPSLQPTYIKRTVRSEKMNDDSIDDEQQLDSQDSPNPYHKIMGIQRSLKNDKINRIKESELNETTNSNEEIKNEEITTETIPYVQKISKSNEESEKMSTKTTTISTPTTESDLIINNSSKLDLINDDSSLDWSSLIDNDSEKTIYESFYELLDNELDKKGRYERKSNKNLNTS